MINTVRTTIRIRKDLLDQSKMLAIKRGTSLQQIINESLFQGLQEGASRKSRKEIMASIDKLREKIYKKHGSLEVHELVAENKHELQKRTDHILDIREKK